MHLRGALTLEVNRPSCGPDEEGGLEIKGDHCGLVDGSGWVRVERWVRPLTETPNTEKIGQE